MVFAKKKKRVRCAVMVWDVLNFENSFNTNLHKTSVSSSINSLSISEICVPPYLRFNVEFNGLTKCIF